MENNVDRLINQQGDFHHSLPNLNCKAYPTTSFPWHQKKGNAFADDRNAGICNTNKSKRDVPGQFNKFHP